MHGGLTTGTGPCIASLQFYTICTEVSSQEMVHALHRYSFILYSRRSHHRNWSMHCIVIVLYYMHGGLITGTGPCIASLQFYTLCTEVSHRYWSMQCIVIVLYFMHGGLTTGTGPCIASLQFYTLCTEVSPQVLVHALHRYSFILYARRSHHRYWSMHCIVIVLVLYFMHGGLTTGTGPCNASLQFYTLCTEVSPQVLVHALHRYSFILYSRRSHHRNWSIHFIVIVLYFMHGGLTTGTGPCIASLQFYTIFTEVSPQELVHALHRYSFILYARRSHQRYWSMHCIVIVLVLYFMHGGLTTGTGPCIASLQFQFYTLCTEVSTQVLVHALHRYSFSFILYARRSHHRNWSMHCIVIVLCFMHGGLITGTGPCIASLQFQFYTLCTEVSSQERVHALHRYSFILYSRRSHHMNWSMHCIVIVLYYIHGGLTTGTGPCIASLQFYTLCTEVSSQELVHALHRYSFILYARRSHHRYWSMHCIVIVLYYIHGGLTTGTGPCIASLQFYTLCTEVSPQELVHALHRYSFILYARRSHHRYWSMHCIVIVLCFMHGGLITGTGPCIASLQFYTICTEVSPQILVHALHRYSFILYARRSHHRNWSMHCIVIILYYMHGGLNTGTGPCIASLQFYTLCTEVSPQVLVHALHRYSFILYARRSHHRNWSMHCIVIVLYYMHGGLTTGTGPCIASLQFYTICTEVSPQELVHALHRYSFILYARRSHHRNWSMHCIVIVLYYMHGGLTTGTGPCIASLQFYTICTEVSPQELVHALYRYSFILYARRSHHRNWSCIASLQFYTICTEVSPQELVHALHRYSFILYARRSHHRNWSMHCIVIVLYYMHGCLTTGTGPCIASLQFYTICTEVSPQELVHALHRYSFILYSRRTTGTGPCIASLQFYTIFTEVSPQELVHALHRYSFILYARRSHHRNWSMHCIVIVLYYIHGGLTTGDWSMHCIVIVLYYMHGGLTTGTGPCIASLQFYTICTEVTPQELVHALHRCSFILYARRSHHSNWSMHCIVIVLYYIHGGLTTGTGPCIASLQFYTICTEVSPQELVRALHRYSFILYARRFHHRNWSVHCIVIVLYYIHGGLTTETGPCIASLQFYIIFTEVSPQELVHALHRYSLYYIHGGLTTPLFLPS